MSHRDESIMRALSTETNTDNVTGCATCREMRREKTRLIAVHMKLFSTSPDLRIWCGFLPLPERREFLLHSWDFQDVLRRLDNCMNRERVLHRHNWAH